MTPTAQLKDSCQRFAEHVEHCATCDLALNMDNDWEQHEILSIDIAVTAKPTLCQTGRELFLDIFN